MHEHGIQVNTEREEVKQRKLTDIFMSANGKKSTINQSSGQKNDERFILGRRVTLWLCKDLLPFKSIENRGFRDLWKSLNLDIDLPSRQTVSVSALDDMYSCMKKELIALLKNSAGVCINIECVF